MEKAKKQVYLFGDSIAKGIAFDDETGKYTYLKNNFAASAAESNGVILNNKSRFGCTVNKGREIISRVLQCLKKDVTIDYAFLEFGGNDCDHNWDEISLKPLIRHNPKTPIDEFISVYKTIVDVLKKNSITTVIMTLPPIASDLYFNWVSKNNPLKSNILTWLGGNIENIYYWHERYNSAVWEVAEKTDSLIIDIRKSFLEDKNYKRFLCIDGIHLNQEGHNLVKNTILGSDLVKKN
ncbi:MAG: SGNH/GDSL hydrolase family protein [Spirochaetia bacterium]|jgi:lysophospholipase L1-like esterase|nr:SGNH/GDSL hydrolase family protein [Spirochaetia bacterium]